jgi:putative two-component system response regulator
MLHAASPMHDVGKVGVPDRVLLKPAALTAEERAQMEEHAEIGYRILAGSRAELLQLAATIAWTHHERVDGRGYPRRLAGDEIPLEGRIAAVADVFDALTRDRVYRPRFSRAQALEMLAEGRGSQFDADVVDALTATV